MLNIQTAGPVDEHDSGFAMSSPLLFDMVDHFSEEEHYQILDVLPARQGVLDLFAQLSCKLYLPGCSRILSDMSTDELESVDILNMEISRALGLERIGAASLQVIFLWDLPNYMDTRVLASLVDNLRPYFAGDVRMHLYMHTRQTMPARPSRYTIMADGKVQVDDICPQTRTCPLYYQEALQDLLYPFRVNRSILLATGIQEYILTL